MTQEAKNQWEKPLAYYPPEDICDPHSADLPEPPYRSDPWKEHHSRARLLGTFLKVWIPKEKSYFRTYEAFKRWIDLLPGPHGFPGPDGEAMRESLIHVGLWWAGISGQPGGPQLIQMQAEIVVYARIHGGDLG